MKQFRGLTERIGAIKSEAQLQKKHEKESLAVQIWDERACINDKGRIRENQRSPKTNWIKNQRRNAEEIRNAILNQFIISDPHSNFDTVFTESADCPIEVIDDLLESHTSFAEEIEVDNTFSENLLMQVSPQLFFEAEYPFNPRINQAKETGLMYKELIIGIINRSNLPKEIQDQLKNLKIKKVALKNSLSEDLGNNEIAEKIKEIEEKIKGIEGIFQPMVSQAYYGLKEAQAILAKKKRRSAAKVDVSKETVNRRAAKRKKLPVVTRKIYHYTLGKVRSNIDNIVLARHIEL